MVKSSNPKRVLHIVSAMNRGGAETLLMNVYRNIDKSKLQFDFISHRSEICHYDNEIESLGGKVFRTASLGQDGPIRYVKKLKNIMRQNEYIAVHAHTDYQCGFPLLAAKLSGIKKRISHSHSNNWGLGNGIKSDMILKSLQMIIKYNSNQFCACSDEAGKFLFGQGEKVNRKIKVLKNGIDVTVFTKNLDCYTNVRKELMVSDNAKILGHVGTFSESKNQIFILRILKELLKDRKDIFVVLVGEGPLKNQIEKEAKKLNVEDHVKFLGVRSDIPRLMEAFDVFLFPSIFEGFGIVAIEAQSKGVPCVVSDKIPKTTDMNLGLITYLKLEDSVKDWLETINIYFTLERPDQEIIKENITKLGYDIKENISEWVELYDIV